MKKWIILSVLFATSAFALSPLSPIPVTNLSSGSASPAAARVDLLEAVNRQNFDKKVRLSQFANFSTAKAAIGNTPKTLIIDTTSNVNTLTCPSTLTLDHETGGLLTIASGKIVTIPNFIYKGNEQVFAGSGTVTGLKEARPEYFDPNTTPGTTDMAAAFTKALAASNVVKLSNTTYAIGSTISLATGNKTIRGVSGGNMSKQHTVINHLASSTGELFNVGGSENGAVAIMNVDITGGNGSFAIVSERPYVRYEYVNMEPYNGGGIQLKSSAGGSSSSTIRDCQWVGPASPTAYTGFEINVNGGDVALRHCTAIRGAIGINIIQGQTITIDECSLNKQTRSTFITGGVAFSSATQFNTAGIKLSGTTTGAGTQASPYVNYKQSISIRNSYIEACDNSIYVESAQSLSIEDNWIDTGGAIGVVGSQYTYGNSAIFLKDNTVQNVTIRNNNILSTSASNINDTAHNLYLMRFNAATNVKYENNMVNMQDGTNIGEYYLTTSPSVFVSANTVLQSISNAVSSYDPSGLIKTIAAVGTATWTAPTLSGTWTLTGGGTESAGYMKDGFGRVWLKGAVGGGTGVIFVLPAGYAPTEQASYTVNASGVPGIVTVFTNGNITLTVGTPTYVYLSGISFKP